MKSTKTSVSRTKKATKEDAGDTVARAQDAVLEILEEQGVLAGINLNEVAKHAKVNRGLVYHYFGTRRGLLRSAIARRMKENQEEIRTPKEPMKLGDRVVHALRRTLGRTDTLRLATLLHLDGSAAPKLMPNAETTLILLERDREMKLVPDHEDLEALHVSYAALVYGYVLFREIFARDLDIDAEELDTRMEHCIARLFDDPEKKSR